jgi:hypothetical protein
MPILPPQVAQLFLMSYSLATEQPGGQQVQKASTMQPLWCNVAALAVVLIFFVWRTHQQVMQRRQRSLRERVAYMLWVMSEEPEESTSSVEAS